MISYCLVVFVVDMINMLKLSFVASCCCWVYSPGDPISAIAV